MPGQDAQGVTMQAAGAAGDGPDEQVASITVRLHTAHGDHLTGENLPSVIKQTLVERFGKMF